MGAGESIVFLVAVLGFYVLPLVLTVWALLTLARLRRGQTDILARLTALERKLKG